MLASGEKDCLFYFKSMGLIHRMQYIIIDTTSVYSGGAGTPILDGGRELFSNNVLMS